MSKKVALITGGMGGIGTAICRQLHADGHVVATTFTNPEKRERWLAANPALAAHTYPCDITDWDSCAALQEKITGELGQVDILVNNAGIQHTARVEDFPRDKWDDILAINLSSAFHASAAVLPDMRQNNYGRIINIASAHGLVASKEKAAYVSAKHAMVGLTKVVALENAEVDITCNAICPGWVLTPLVQAQIDKIAASQKISNEAATETLLQEKQPSRRFTRAEDVAAAVLFLLSPAGDNMTGSCLTMDGGWTSQ